MAVTIKKISLSKNVNQALSLDDLKWQIGESYQRLEDYLNGKIDIYVRDSKTSPKEPRPNFNKGDLLFDFSATPGVATLQQWDGTKLVFLGFNSIVGHLPQVYNEKPSGVQDGFNFTFNTAFKYALTTTRLFLNGQRLKLGASFDYTEHVNLKTITFISIIPVASDTIIIDYNTQ